MFQGQGE